MQFNEAQMRAAQEQMANMSNEDLIQQVNNMTEAERAQMRSMGMDPDAIKQAVNADPNFANNAREQMKEQDPASMARSMQNKHNAAQAEATQARMAAAEADLPGLPIGTRVVLQRLKSADHNGKCAVVRGPLKNNGRQDCFIEEMDKVVSFKAENLDPEVREAESLSVREMKHVLRAKGVADSEQRGLDKAGLAELIEEHVMPDEEISVLLARGVLIEKKQKSGGGTNPLGPLGAEPKLNPEQMKSAAEKMDNMNPEDLKRQATFMKTLPKEQLKRMNPQFANMSDQQIDMAISQMEMMANNPAMMKMAAQQMKTMTPAQMEQMRQGVMGGGGGSAGGGGGSSGGGGGGGGTPNVPMDPSQLVNMDPAQLKSMLKTFKENPAMVENMSKMMPGVDAEAMKKQLDMIDQMDPKTLQSLLGWGQWAQKTLQPYKPLYDKMNAATGGNFVKILIGIIAVFFFFSIYRIIMWLFFGSWLFYPPNMFTWFSSASSTPQPELSVSSSYSMPSTTDEFGGDTGFGGASIAQQQREALESKTVEVGLGGDMTEDDEFD